MSWLTGKRAYILSISLSVLYKAKSFACCSLPSLSCAVYSTWKLAHTCSSHFIPRTQTVSCPAVTSLLSLLLLCTPFLLHFFCTMPQGPPGPQGSPHPQPPPPNSMMGPHAQVMLHLSLFFLLFLFFFFPICAVIWECWFSVLMLCALAFIAAQCFVLFSVFTQIYFKICWYSLIKISWNHDVFVTVLHVTSFCRRPKRPPHKDGQPGRSCIHVHVLNASHHVNIELHF